MTQKLQINLLGTPELLLDGEPITGLVSRKAEALFAYLAANPRAHARETLATLLWDDAAPQRALANLSVLLSSLRKQLAPFFLADRQEIRFNPHADFTLDTAVFEDTVTTARQQLRQHGRATRTIAAKLTQALALYRDDFMAGFALRGAAGFEEWALLERERLQRQAIEALDALVDFYLARGKNKTGIEHAARLVQLDPLRERSHRQLMRLLAAAGQRNAALEQYDACCDVLADELGVSPTAETTALFHAIRRGEWNAPQTAAAPRHNLPAPATSFVGRAAELAQIEARLADPACRLLTLVGPGGSGKTRLLLEAARTQLGDFLDGVWLAPLASLPDGGYLETAVAQAVGYDFGGKEPPRVQLLTFLRQKELLLALDGFEHLLDDAGIGFLADLLAQAPDVKVLVSSRERLALQAEWLQEITGLPTPPHEANGRWQAYGAVQLFAQRARQVDAQFDPAVDETAVRRICHLVAGMPLALELAAAGVRHYNCAEIAAALSENIDFLSTTQRDVPARHRSLRAAFDHSWRLLTPDEQQAFAMLAVFRGSFGLDAARAVLPTPPPLLLGLVDKSLVQRTQHGRFQLHDLLRQYAADKLSALAETAVLARNRHGAYFARFLQQRYDDLQGGRQLGALEEIQTEIENVRAAWEYARTLPPDTPDLIRLIGPTVHTMFQFYAMRSWFREGAAVLQQAVDWLAAAEGDAARLLHAQLQARAGWLAYLLGRVESGIDLLQRSLAYLEETGAESDVIFCLNYLGVIAYNQQDYAAAQAYLQRSLARAQTGNDVPGAAIAHNILGAVRTALEDWSGAEAALQTSLQLKREIGDQWGIAFSLAALGRVDVALNRRTAARAHYEESLALSEELGDRRGTALCLQQLGELAAQDGDAAAARDLYTRCLTILQEIGAARGQARIQQRLDALEKEIS